MCEQLLFNVKDAAAFLGVPEGTLRWWNSDEYTRRRMWTEKGPSKVSPVRVDGRLYYHRADLLRFAEEVRRGLHAG